MLSGVPEKEDEVVVPAAVRMIAAGRRARPVWLNALGGTTFEVTGDVGHHLREVRAGRQRAAAGPGGRAAGLGAAVHPGAPGAERRQ